MENRTMAVAAFVRRYFTAVLCMLGCMLLAVASIGQAVAGTAAPGYAVLPNDSLSPIAIVTDAGLSTADWGGPLPWDFLLLHCPC